MSSFIVDCDVDPIVPEGLKILSHQRGGQLNLRQTRVVPFFSTKQQKGGTIEGKELFRELALQPIMNANVLDFLLDHSELIELILKEWEWEKVYGSELFFLGTIFLDENEDKYVCCLRRRLEGGGWCRGVHFVGSTFFPQEAVAISVAGDN